MHCNNYLFSEFQQTNSNQNDLICLVLTEFPPRTDLIETKFLIEEGYPTINKIHVPNSLEIQCYFDSMTDLIEIDQGKKYGAARAFIRNHLEQLQKSIKKIDFQKSQEVFQNSSQTFESETQIEVPSYKLIPLLQTDAEKTQKKDLRQIHRPMMERLTSLEYEIKQLELMKEKLCLLKDDINWGKTSVTEFVRQQSKDEKCNLSADKKFSNQEQKELGKISDKKKQSQQEQKFQHQDNPQGKQMILSLIEGAALTGIIYGGFKILKNYIQ